MANYFFSSLQYEGHRYSVTQYEDGSMKISSFESLYLDKKLVEIDASGRVLMVDFPPEKMAGLIQAAMDLAAARQGKK